MGLRILSMYCTKQIQRRFYGIGLGIQLTSELSQFHLAIPQEQNEIIELLGSATLFGWIANRDSCSNIPLDAVCDLPLSVLPHRADASKVEEWQYQLWLGLRAFVSITRKSLPISDSVINQILNLWLVNLAESSINPNSVEHRVNREMVDWLKRCVQSGKGLI